MDLERRLAAVPADERGDHPLAVHVHLAEPLHDLARRRLGDQQQRLGRVVGGEHAHRLAEHDPADLGRQVAPADADDLRHADARRASSRIAASWAPVPAAATIPTVPGTDDVGEAEPDLPEHRGPAAGAHHEQPQLRAAALELDLVGGGHVVGEQEDVQPRGQRAVRFERPRTRPGRRSARRWRPGGCGRRPSASAAARPRGVAAGRVAARTAPARPAPGRDSGPFDRDHDVGRRRVAGTPSAASVSRFAGVPIATSARVTPSCARSSFASRISRTLST